MDAKTIMTWQHRVKINGTWEGDAMKLEIDDLRAALQSQAERINELERESETHAVIAMLQAYGAACAAHARERALSEAIAICRRNAQNTSADELEALKGK